MTNKIHVLKSCPYINKKVIGNEITHNYFFKINKIMATRITLFIAMLLASVTMAFSQDNDPWVGTWTSVSYTGCDYQRTYAPENNDYDGAIINYYKTQWKLIIRITKNGDSYSIRTKRVNQNNPSDVRYDLDCHVTKVSGNTIYYESYIKKDPEKINGNISGYRDVTYYYKLTLSKGTLKYDHYNYSSIYYDSNMRIIEEEKDRSMFCNGDDCHLSLFNDDW